MLIILLVAGCKKKKKRKAANASSDATSETESNDNNEIDIQDNDVLAQENQTEDTGEAVVEEEIIQEPAIENEDEQEITEITAEKIKPKRERSLDVDILSYGINLYKTLSIKEVNLANQVDSLDDEIRLLYNKIKRLARLVPKTDGQEKEALVKELENCREERNEKLKLRENLYIYSFEVAKAKNEYIKEIEEI